MKIMKAIAMIVLLVSFAMAAVAVGNFKLQYPSGINVVIMDSTGNVNATGKVAENGIWIEQRYVNMSMRTNDNTSMWSSVTSYANNVNASSRAYADTQDNLQDECSEITNCVANAWDALSDMTLATNQIYVGDGSNDPAAVAMSGDATILSTGVVTVVDNMHLHAIANITNLVSSQQCTAGQILKNVSITSSGLTSVCVADSGGTDAWLNSTVTGVETANGVYNYTALSTIALADGSRITGKNIAATNATIDSTGNFIIVLG